MYRLLAYLIPFILIAIEYGLRFALKTDTAGFVGPTLATAAVGLLVPALALKSRSAALSPEFQQELIKLKATVRSSTDERLAALSLLLLLIFIAAWVWTLILAERNDAVTIFYFDRPVFIGLSCYMVSVVVAELKEAA
ncbi:hypothetical protein [Ramlibacter tataouinensis]|uniref:hypothetical protein n=1 Tax=Ramlibacter tataouinensis TaxID=94132 RepID=UPI00059EF089|nr:hypothetical protein [Ramlibacter tataouinensis]